MELNDCCIVSVGVNPPYNKFIPRLKASLINVGWNGGMMIDDRLPIQSPAHNVNPYAFKFYAILNAMAMDYNHVLWADSSFIARQHPQPIFDSIKKHGMYSFRTGYNLSQTTSDEQARHFDISRNSLETIPEFAAGCIGFNFYNNQWALDAFEMWGESMRKGLFKGGTSTDIRFKHFRHDQPCVSLAIFKSGIEIPESNFISYQDNPSVIFNIKHKL